MTEEQWELLNGAAVHFHQDFDLVDWTARDLFAAYSRGLEVDQRDAFYASLEALLRTHLNDEDFDGAWLTAGAHGGPSRTEVQDFLAWSDTPEGRTEIESPGPTIVVQVNYGGSAT